MPALDPLPGISAPAPQELELKPAKIGDRFIAYAFDALPFAAGLTAMVFYPILKLHQPVTPARLKALAAAWFAGYLLYQFLGTASGGTLGKRLLGLRVVRSDGTPLGVFRSLVRSLGYALSTPFFNFGFIIALFHPESRALHDIVSGSLVIEPKSRNPAESAVLFLGAFCLMVGMFGSTVFLTVATPTPEDRAAVERAKNGVMILAQIEDAYKARTGAYTKDSAELAKESGNERKFRSAMKQLFDPELVEIEAGSKAYRITVAALDGRKTRVRVEGPPAALVVP